MIWSVLETAAIVAECFMVTDCLARYFPYKNKKWNLLKSSVLFAVLFVIEIFGTNEMHFLLGFIGAEIVFSLVFLKGKIYEKILISIVLYLLFFFVNMPVLHILGLISHTDSSSMTEAQDIWRIICLFTTKILYFAATRVMLFVCKKEQYYFKKNEWIIVLSAFIITLAVSFSLYTITEWHKISKYILVIVVLLLSALDVIIFLFMRRLNLVNRREIEQKIVSLQLEQQQNEIRQLDEQYQRIAVLQHDFQNSIDCICRLIECGNYEKAISYANTLYEKNSVLIHTHINCSSSIVNAVINEKFSIAQSYGIRCTCQIVIPISTEIEYDLSIMLANLLNNAIEACQKIKDMPQIILTISEKAGYYRVIAKNTIADSVLQNNQNLETSKSDKSRHGWGMQSVRNIADSHNGSVDVYERNQMFIVSVLLMKQT